MCKDGREDKRGRVKARKGRMRRETRLHKVPLATLRARSAAGLRLPEKDVVCLGYRCTVLHRPAPPNTPPHQKRKMYFLFLSNHDQVCLETVSMVRCRNGDFAQGGVWEGRRDVALAQLERLTSGAGLIGYIRVALSATFGFMAAGLVLLAVGV